MVKNIFNQYKDEIIHNTKIIPNYESDCSIGSGYSIYDDDLETNNYKN